MGSLMPPQDLIAVAERWEVVSRIECGRRESFTLERIVGDGVPPLPRGSRCFALPISEYCDPCLEALAELLDARLRAGRSRRARE